MPAQSESQLISPVSPIGGASRTSTSSRLLSDGARNAAAFVVSGGAGIVLVPFLLHGLGTELYGIWIAACSAAALVGLADAGLGWSLTREIANAEASEAQDGLDTNTSALISSIFQVYLLTGLVGAIIVFAAG